MPLIHLGNKIRQYKQLAVLQQRRLNRSADPISASQREQHRTALLRVADILKQNWALLLFERRFLQNYRTYTEYLTKAEVVDKLLAALVAYEKCLTHQAADTNGVRYDLTDFERSLDRAISTVHDAGKTVHYEAVGIPKTSWACVQEYQGWKANRRDLMNPSIGKLRITQSEVPEFGNLMDGRFTVTFSDEMGEDAEELPLGGTLPEKLMETFDKTYRHAADMSVEMLPPDLGLEEEAAVPVVVPQGRKKRTKKKYQKMVHFELKRVEEVIDEIKTEAEDTIDAVAVAVEVAPVAPIRDPSFHIALRRRNAMGRTA